MFAIRNFVLFAIRYSLQYKNVLLEKKQLRITHMNTEYKKRTANMNKELRIPNMNNEISHMNSELRMNEETKYHNKCSVDNEEHITTP